MAFEAEKYIKIVLICQENGHGSIPITVYDRNLIFPGWECEFHLMLLFSVKVLKIISQAVQF